MMKDWVLPPKDVCVCGRKRRDGALETYWINPMCQYRDRDPWTKKLKKPHGEQTREEYSGL